MPKQLTADDHLQREFLHVRARILDIAAALDRIESSPGDATTDPRTRQIGLALQELSATGADRAERVQMIFSRDYVPEWRKNH